MVILYIHTTVQLYVQSMITNKGSGNKTLAELKTPSSFFTVTAASLQTAAARFTVKQTASPTQETPGRFVGKGLFTFGQKNSTLCEVK